MVFVSKLRIRAKPPGMSSWTACTVTSTVCSTEYFESRVELESFFDEYEADILALPQSQPALALTLPPQFCCELDLSEDSSDWVILALKFIVMSSMRRKGMGTTVSKGTLISVSFLPFFTVKEIC